MNSSENQYRPDSMSPEDVAAFWLIQQDQGAVLNDDPAFVAWLAGSPDHLRAWDRVTSVWKGFDGNSDPLLEAMRRDALTARRETGAWKLGAIAATVAIGLIGGAIAWRIFGTGPTYDLAAPIIPPSAVPTFVANGAAPETFSLPDGSQVTLDAKAAIAVRYSAQRRAVRLLRGRAFFRVIHAPARPFTTDVADSVISDLGTDFDVLMQERGLSVTLINGSIAVATKTGGGHDTLIPGQRLEVTPGQPNRIVAADLQEVAAWRNPYIEFHGEPLEQALAQINRYGGAPARIMDPAIRTIRVSGRFRAGDPARFARAIAEIYSLRVGTRPDGGVNLTKK